jgi:hypothetical protein
MARTLSSDEIKALTNWPRGVSVDRAEPVDFPVLLALFNELLGEFPWWNKGWQVTRVAPARPIPNKDASFTEVFVTGEVGGLAFVGRVRFEGDQLIRFEAKVGDVVVCQGLAAAGQLEPHPFGKVLDRLMELRGISGPQMAKECLLAMATITSLRAGFVTPNRTLVTKIAGVLGMPVEDLVAVAGLDS